MAWYNSIPQPTAQPTVTPLPTTAPAVPMGSGGTAQDYLGKGIEELLAQARSITGGVSDKSVPQMPIQKQNPWANILQGRMQSPFVGGVSSPRLMGQQVPGMSSYRMLGRLGQTAQPQNPRGLMGRMQYNTQPNWARLLGGR